ncbi:MAG TPA: SIR2 family protein [Candidatus Acidoferrales bacterium]|nr:SIR2 family protein [Candidatus Acidoferrales bacterium]
MANDQQILKSRDDKDPVILAKATEASDGAKPYVLANGCESSWLKKDVPVGISDLRPRIEPWLTALFQSEHLGLLIGSGLSHAVHRSATGTALSGMSAVKFAHFNTEISAEAKKSAEASGREAGNIEDQIRVANELLRGLEIIASSDKKIEKQASDLRGELKKILDDFAESILKGEKGLITAKTEDLERAFNYLVSFLMSFASRTGTRDRLQIFTTNYDRFIEAGAELAGLHLLDRFVGSLAPIFRSSRLDVDMHYNPPGIRGEPRYLEGVARFTKLHGSLDWMNTAMSIRRIGLPFGADSIAPYLKAPGLAGANALQLMIYPNSAKDRETAAYPYVDLFRDFAAAVCRPNSTLIAFGYSFGDEHINRVIEDMLTIPSTHLVIISHGDPLGRIMRTYTKLGRRAQITLLIGDHLGDFQALVDNYLPKSAIDRTTFRMAELLKARWTAGRTESPEEKKNDSGGEGA